ncbi:MAG: hypothetical protein NXI31_21305 [bacterium]|nr:hypothetical protein [bacterium]
MVRYDPRAGVEPPPNAPGLAVQQVWAGGRNAPADSRLWRPLDDYHLVEVEPGTRRARFGHPHGDVVVEQAEATLRPELLRSLLPSLRPASARRPADSREERGASQRR